MSLLKNSPLVKRSLCTYPFTTKSKAFFFFFLTSACDVSSSSVFTFWPCSKKEEEKKKLLPFLFTLLLLAININDSGLCDDEIPPSSLSAAVTYPADVSVDGLQHFFETDLCWHPWRCTRWSIAAAEGTKNHDRCLTFKKKTNKKKGKKKTKPEHNHEVRNGQLSIGWLALCGKVFPLSYQIYLLMHGNHLLMAPNTQRYSVRCLMKTFLYAENKY